MSKNVIFCFSGTGNCLDIAKNIAKELGDTDIVLLRGAPELTDVREAQRVGFVFPCHAGGLPGGLEEHIRRVMIAPGAYKFAVVSYAGYPGVGLRKVHEIVGLDYWAGVSHQSACIWLMPHTMMLPMLSPEKAQQRAENFAALTVSDILAGKKREGKPSAPAFNKLETSLWPKLMKKKAGQLAVGDGCTGCGQCAGICPRGNIRLAGGKPQFGADCVQCLSCLQYCPAQAIHMGGATLKRERYHNPNVSARELMQKVIHMD